MIAAPAKNKLILYLVISIGAVFSCQKSTLKDAPARQTQPGQAEIDWSDRATNDAMAKCLQFERSAFECKCLIDDLAKKHEYHDFKANYQRLFEQARLKALPQICASTAPNGDKGGVDSIEEGKDNGLPSSLIFGPHKSLFDSNFSNADSPKISQNDKGLMVLVYQQVKKNDDKSLKSSEVLAQVSTDYGKNFSDAIQLSNSGKIAINPLVVHAKDSRSVIIWAEMQDSLYNIYARSHSPGSDFSAAPVLITKEATIRHSLAYDAKNDTFWISWDGKPAADYGIQAATFDTKTQKPSDIVNISGFTATYTSVAASLTFNSDGLGLIAWKSYGRTATNPEFKVFSSAFSANKWGPPIEVTTSNTRVNATQKDGLPLSSFQNIAVGVSIGGHKLIAYSVAPKAYEPDKPYKLDVYLSKDTGSNIETMTLSKGKAEASFPSIVFNNNAKAMIIWREKDDKERQNFFTRIYSETDQSFTEPLVVDKKDRSTTWYPDLLPLAKDNFAIVYTQWQKTDEKSSYRLKASIYQSDKNSWQQPAKVATKLFNGDSSFPALGYGKDDSLIVVWRQNTGIKQELFISTNGN